MEESMYVHELAGQLVQQHRCSGLMESVACCTITERRRKYVSILRSRLHLDGKYTILSLLLFTFEFCSTCDGTRWTV